MADNPVSKTGGGNPVRVQLPPPAPFFYWSENLAYAVGLITTDGNLCSDKRHIQFTTTDYQLAKHFRTCLLTKNKIRKTPPSGFGKKPAFRINFSNVKLYSWLEQIGLMSKKSLLLRKLNIPEKYFPDFIRGHIDGDGSIFTYVDNYAIYKGKRYTYKRLYTVFNSASADHLEWIRANLEKILNIAGALSSYRKKDRKFPMWKLRYAKKESLKLLSWLYYKENLPCLQRKRKIADRFLRSFS